VDSGKSFVKNPYTRNMGLEFGKLPQKLGELAALLIDGQTVRTLVQLVRRNAIFNTVPSPIRASTQFCRLPPIKNVWNDINCVSTLLSVSFIVGNISRVSLKIRTRVI